MVLMSQKPEQTEKGSSVLDIEIQAVFISCCNYKILPPACTGKGSMGFWRTALVGIKEAYHFFQVL